MKLSGWAASLAITAAVGCAGTGLIDDGTSLSFGPPNDGALIEPAALPAAGEGYEMPEADQRESHCTMLLATHNMGEVERMCSDVLMLRGGVIVAVSPMTTSSGRTKARKVSGCQ